MVYNSSAVIFQFLKYIAPTRYYNLRPKIDHGYFPSPEQLQQEGCTVTLDAGYISEHGQKLDVAWNAFHAGYISHQSACKGIDVWTSVAIPVQDEYRFIRKNFSSFWSWYVLFFRLITFHSPLEEIRGFWKARKVARIDHSRNQFKHAGYEKFESPLIKRNPLVSIIIPTLNRYSYLKDVLRDIGNQTYTNFEVIVVDQSEPYQESFFQGWNFPLQHWFQEEKALWKARNSAIQAAKGNYILLYDDDSLVENDWVEQHLKTLDFFKADLSSGVSISVLGAKVPEHYAYFRWSDQLDTGNVLVKREVFEAIGLFDRQFEKQRMGDGEYGLRAYLAGFRNISNPFAKRVHLKVQSGGLRQMGSWDAWRPRNLFAPRPIPSVLYFYRRYFGRKDALRTMLISLLPSLIPYKFKSKPYLVWIPLLMFPIVVPIVLLQALVSWKLADQKLKMGPLIDNLE